MVIFKVRLWKVEVESLEVLECEGNGSNTPTPSTFFLRTLHYKANLPDLQVGTFGASVPASWPAGPLLVSSPTLTLGYAQLGAKTFPLVFSSNFLTSYPSLPSHYFMFDPQCRHMLLQ